MNKGQSAPAEQTTSSPSTVSTSSSAPPVRPPPPAIRSIIQTSEPRAISASSSLFSKFNSSSHAATSSSSNVVGTSSSSKKQAKPNSTTTASDATTSATSSSSAINFPVKTSPANETSHTITPIRSILATAPNVMSTASPSSSPVLASKSSSLRNTPPPPLSGASVVANRLIQGTASSSSSSSSTTTSSSQQSTATNTITSSLLSSQRNTTTIAADVNKTSSTPISITPTTSSPASSPLSCSPSTGGILKKHRAGPGSGTSSPSMRRQQLLSLLPEDKADDEEKSDEVTKSDEINSVQFALKDDTLLAKLEASLPTSPVTSPISPTKNLPEVPTRFLHHVNTDKSAAMRRRRQTIFVSDRAALTRSSFAQQQRHHEMEMHGSHHQDYHSDRHGDDLIVTPFAQILASLRNVRTNFMQLTRLPLGRTKSGVRQQSSKGDASSAIGQISQIDPSQCPQSDPLNTNVLIDDEYIVTAAETFDELQWCLEQLEQVHARRSVADMATVKFRQMLNRELSNFSNKGAQGSGNQVTNYIVSTFLETNNELDAGGSSADEGISSSASATPLTTASGGATAYTAPAGASSGAHQTAVASRPSLSLISNNIARFGVQFDSEAQMAHLEELLPSIDAWGPDVFSFSKAAAGRPLTAVAFHIFKKRELLSKFSILPTRFLQFITRLEGKYRTETQVAYHNSQHAADVLQTVHALLNADALLNVFTDLEIFAVLFASALHDVDHPGLINQYLVNTCHDLAILYNDISVLENHHLAVAFALLREEDSDILSGMTLKQRQQIRKLTIDMVLATDMSKHMSLLADLKTMVETKKVTSSGVIILDNYTDKLTVLQNLIHCGDLSNPTKPLPIYQEWVRRIMNEFWNQGDIERRLKIDISPMCDRHNANVEKSQVGFIDYIVHPLWETWAELVQPDAQDVLDQLEENRNYYHSKMEEQQQQNQQQQASPPGASPSTS